MLDVEDRVSHLEELMAGLIATVEQTSREMRLFKNEMREFKDEMREFKDEMREFKNEMLEFKDEMHEFKDEMTDFKDEMRGFKNEMSGFKNETRREIGELSRKLGTLAEDLVAPGVPKILRQLTGCREEEIIFEAVRVKRYQPKNQEFDVVAVCAEVVLINETKGNLKPEHITEFCELMGNIRAYFPEYVDQRFIGTIASLYVDDSLVRYGERQGLIVLGFGEDLMDVLNTPGFTPKAW